ncbi:MAG: response regulator [Alphaproteobacteria bacterium]|nr:response regulator [Alphaproteobacteria bacterium]
MLARLRASAANLFGLTPWQRIVSLLPGISASVLVLSVAALIALTALYRSQLDLISHTENVNSTLARSFASVQDAELGLRGYLLTGDETYIDRMEKVRGHFEEEYASLAALTQHNAAQQASLKELRDLARRHLEANLNSLSRAKAGARVQSIYPLDSIRDIVLMMQRREGLLLRQRIDDAAATSVWLFLAATLPIVLVAWALWLWLRDRQAGLGARALHTADTKSALVTLNAAHDATAGEGIAREAAEGQVRQLQKMEAVGQLTGGIAHDFNNMNAVVMSAISLCRKRLARGETDIASLLDAAMDAAQRSAALTARLLAFSRLQQLSPEVLDPSQFISSMTDLLRRTLGENISIETVLGGGLWRTNADASQLENVILNLCVNARDAMPGGGKLTLETANVSLDDAYARANVDVVPGQYVMIAVTDNGEGMPPEVVARAFEPFFTTKPVGEGTGLGLSQVFGFVKQSGGNVSIYSELGKGTTIKVYLPRFVGVEKAVLEAEPHRLIPRGNAGEIILVVEDERRLREVTVAGLRELGYTVIHADGGANALLKLEHHPEIGCLFTDMIMPGMSGRQLADEATRRWPGLKVLFTTGYARESVVHNRTLAKSANFLPKPYTLDDLALKMRTMLETPLSAPAA